MPQQGAIRIGDALASEGGRAIFPPEELGIAMVFQDLALWPHLTVRRNLELGLECKKVPRDEREVRMAPLLARVGPAGKERRHPGELSGGERQRGVIARARARAARGAVRRAALEPSTSPSGARSSRSSASCSQS